jgi:H+/Cl- antiporter ClcA
MRIRSFSLNNIKPSFVPAIAWIIISIILLTLPGSSFPKENWLDKIWFDKWVHIGMFSILVTLWCWALQKKYSDGARLRTTFIWIGLIGLIYGSGMEFVQKYFIINRSFEIGDIIADGLGCILGAVYSIRRYIKN